MPFCLLKIKKLVASFRRFYFLSRPPFFPLHVGRLENANRTFARCGMRRQIAGLHNAAAAEDQITDGVYLVQVRRVQYRWHAQKPFYIVRYVVLEPKASAR